MRAGLGTGQGTWSDSQRHSSSPSALQMAESKHSPGGDLPTLQLGWGPGHLLLLTLVTWVVVEVERVSAVAP